MDQTAIIAARMLIRERDTAKANELRHPELQYVTAYHHGQAAAFDTALAIIAGTQALGSRQRLEAAIAELDREAEPVAPEPAIETLEPVGGWEPRS